MNDFKQLIAVVLTEGAIKNGYIAIPRNQNLFPSRFVADESGISPAKFVLVFPGGKEQETCILGKYGRIQARFNSTFQSNGVEPGDTAVISADDSVPDCYRLSFSAMGKVTQSSGKSAIEQREKGMHSMQPLNQILYGPPGTGKTYQTIEAALKILDPEFLAANCDNRAALKGRYDALAESGLIRFVTFHQSFSYEDFVEGLRATNSDDGEIKYEVADGLFKALCESAVARVTQQAEAPVDLTGRRIWKMSLGNTQGVDSYIYDDCIDNGLALLGYGRTIDFRGSRDVDDIARKFQENGVELAADAYAVTAVSNFVFKMQKGDLLVVTDGNLKFRAIGEVVGDYGLQQRGDHYCQSRAVRWLRVYSPSLPYEKIMKKQFSQMTLYELKASAIDMDKLSILLAGEGIGQPAAGSAFSVGQQFGQGYKVTRVSAEIVELDKPNGGQLPMPLSIVRQLADLVSSGKISLNDIRQGGVFEKLGDSRLEKYIVNGYQSLIAAMVQAQLVDGASQNQLANARVLIIDEINRGNISRIFGELITLVEPSKRAGSEEALEVTLPYSKERFSVPNNVYLIGTMNTADRSLAGLDIALRRRFVFREMPPKPELLDEVTVEDVNIGELLRVLNERIEVLLDRDHCLGHAYFLPLKDQPTLDVLTPIFRNQIVPLLQEYFFEDWQRIQWVLNDHRKPVSDRFVRQPALNVRDLFGDNIEVGGHGIRWEVNGEAFTRIEAYRGIIHAVESAQP